METRKLSFTFTKFLFKTTDFLSGFLNILIKRALNRSKILNIFRKIQELTEESFLRNRCCIFNNHRIHITRSEILLVFKGHNKWVVVFLCLHITNNSIQFLVFFHKK